MTYDNTASPDEPNEPGFESVQVERARQLLETMPTTIDRYRVLERIGGGGMGEVYVAEQSTPIKRRVALKVIKVGMDTRQVVARFEAERQALAMMDHPNIARVFDAGATDTGRPYFVMELVRGVPVTQFCDDNKFTPTQRVELLVPICQAVQHAHQKGIIHRDIKPHNVLVTLHDGVPVPKVIDFGIAKATSQPLTDKTVYTEFRQMIGTPAYMSPEQAEMSGLDIDTRSDIYSLGVLAYELLTGSPPFDSARLIKAGLGEIQRIIREEEPPRPSMRFSTMAGDALTTIASSRSTEPARLSKLVAGELDWIVMKALEKDRKRRYDTAKDLAADFARHLKGEPVVAAPPSAAYRMRKLYRRNRAALLTVTTIGAILLFTIIAISALAVRLDRQFNATVEALRLKTISETSEEKERQEAERQRSVAQASERKAEYLAARTKAEYFAGQHLYDKALAAATEAYGFEGKWEDSLLLDQIVASASRSWKMRNSFDLPEWYSASILVRVGSEHELIVATRTSIDRYNLTTGLRIAQLTLDGELITRFVEIPDCPDQLCAVSESTISVISLSSMKRTSTLSVGPNSISGVAAASAQLLLTLSDDSVQIRSIKDLTITGSAQWPKDARRIPGHKLRKLAISKDGDVAVIGEPTYTTDCLIWFRRTGTKLLRRLNGGRLGFSSNSDLFAFANDQSTGSESDSYHIVTHYIASNDQLSFSEVSKVGTEDVGMWFKDTHILAHDLFVATDIGFAIIPMSRTGTVASPEACRFSSILAINNPSLKFVGVTADTEVMAVSIGSKVIVLDRRVLAGGSWNNVELNSAIATNNSYRVTAHSGTLELETTENRPPYRVVNTTTLPFDRADSPESSIFSCGITISQDESTLAVRSAESKQWPIMAETVKDHSVLLYRRSQRSDTEFHKLNTSIRLKAQGWMAHSAARLPSCRILQLSNDGGRLLAGTKVDSGSEAELYDTATGALVRDWQGTSHLGSNIEPIAHSNCFAACSQDDKSIQLIRYDDGEICRSVQVKGGIAQFCMSSDGKQLVVSSLSRRVLVIDIDTMQVVREISTALRPVTWSCKNDAFVAMSMESDQLNLGSMVIADCFSGDITAILTKGVEGMRVAEFSESGDALLYQTRSGKGRVVYRLSPADARIMLTGSTVNEAVIRSLLPQSNGRTAPTESVHNTDLIDAKAIDELFMKVGTEVKVRGRVSAVLRASGEEACTVLLEPRTTGVIVQLRRTPVIALEQASRGEAETALRGREIVVSGVVESYCINKSLPHQDLLIDVSDSNCLKIN